MNYEDMINSHVNEVTAGRTILNKMMHSLRLFKVLHWRPTKTIHLMWRMQEFFEIENGKSYTDYL